MFWVTELQVAISGCTYAACLYLHTGGRRGVGLRHMRVIKYSQGCVFSRKNILSENLSWGNFGFKIVEKPRGFIALRGKIRHNPGARAGEQFHIIAKTPRGEIREIPRLLGSTLSRPRGLRSEQFLGITPKMISIKRLLGSTPL